MKFVILIYDKSNKIPFIGGAHDLEKDAVDELELIKTKKRETDKKCEDCGRWVEEIAPDGKMISYYVDKEMLKKSFILDNSGNRKEKYILDLKKARKYFGQTDVENVDDLKCTIKAEIICVESGKAELSTFTSEKGCSIFDEDD